MTEQSRYSETCPSCKVIAECLVDRSSGKYRVTLFAACQTKDECEARILRNSGFEGIVKKEPHSTTTDPDT